jgi:AcrR family transcriptional regulator
MVKPTAEPQSDSTKRDQILEGARKVFLAQGFDGASMGEIAKAAGVSKGTLYVYFDSKESLFEALTKAERGGLAEALFRLDEDDPDTREVLRGLGISYLEMMVRPDHVSSVRMVIGATDKFPRLGQTFYESGPEVGRKRLSAYLDRQVEAGRLAIEDTSVAAEHFLALCASRILKRLLFGAASAPTSPAEIMGTVDAAIRVFFAAYGRKPQTS